MLQTQTLRGLDGRSVPDRYPQLVFVTLILRSLAQIALVDSPLSARKYSP